MRKLVLVSLTVFVAVSVLMTAFAFAEKKVKKIEEKGAFLGIYMEDLEKDVIKDLDYPKSSGVLITGIVDDSPAEEAGLEKHDIIYLISGEKVSDSKELGKLIGSMDPGDEVEIVVYRDGKKKTFDLELGEKKTAYITIDTGDFDLAEDVYVKTLGKHGNIWMNTGGDHFSFYNRGRLGVQLHSLNEDLAPYFKVKEGEGVLVLGVVEDSPAEEAGIKSGDVIVKIDDEEIEEIDDVFEALGRVHVENIKMTVEYDDDEEWIEVKAEDAEDEEDAEEEEEADTTVKVTVLRMGKEKTFEVELEDEFAMNKQFIIKAPQGIPSRHWDVHKAPRMKQMKIHGIEKLHEVEEKELQRKLEALEKEMEKLQKKLEDMEKDD